MEDKLHEMTKNKKKDKKKKEKPVEKKVDSRQESQIQLVILFMVVLIGSIFLVNWLLQRTATFEYAGLEFVKEKSGKILFYKAVFPARDYHGEIAYEFPVYFRNDPRKLADIEIDGEIILKTNVALVAKPEVVNCKKSMLAATTLSMFLGSYGKNPFGGTFNGTEAEENTELTFVSCGSPDKTIIVFSEGETTKIKKDRNCYYLRTADCEVLEVAERFMIGAHAHSEGIDLE